MKKYEYLLFDADNTLLDFDLAEKTAFAEMCDECKVEYSDELYSRYHGINKGLWRMIEQGTITREELKFRRYYDLVGDADVASEMASCYERRLGFQSFLLDGAIELCRELKHEYRLFIVTNGLASIQRSRLGASELPELFEKVYISEEVGFSKPDKRFFDAVISDIGDSDRTRYLVIGDSLTSDIAGAEASGLDSCWYSPMESIPEKCRPTYTVDRLGKLAELLKIGE